MDSPSITAVLVCLMGWPAVGAGGEPRGTDRIGPRRPTTAAAGKPPGTDDTSWRRAQQLAARVRALEPEPFERTRHPDARWFPKAGLGLFMHWGIHSVKGVQPSWAMIKDYPAGGVAEMHPPERYYALAPQFNPQRYDPDAWMTAAKAAGFTYAVLTAKHHDGYALWPTAYGDMSARQYLGGRDLLRPYVDACRKHGLKVGFYFSPGDWHYPGYPIGDVGFDYNRRGKYPPIKDPAQNRRAFEAFYAYTIGQLHELLTRYGKLDVLWFDGMGWHGVSDLHTAQTLAWVRSVQPGIVVNDRWAGVGDFTTPEWNLPKGPPLGWWENCIAWNGHWGYNPRGHFRTTWWVLERLVRVRSWGGNFLLNVGPAPDGTMPQGFYERCRESAAWMTHSRESLIGAGPSPGDDRANVTITTRGLTWYLHVPPNHTGPVELRYVDPPASTVLLRTGETLPCKHDHGTLTIEVPTSLRTKLDDVIALRWSGERWGKAIRAFEQQDARQAPPDGAVLFVGSSSIRGWDVDKSFPDLTTINRGFGGSQYIDVVHYADRIVLPYRPRTIVLYSGDNDLAAGKSPAWVLADLQALVRRVRHALPKTRIVVLSIKLCKARWRLKEQVRQANALIARWSGQHGQVTYVDVATPLLGADGQPRPELFRKDALHLSAAGYEIWALKLRPLLAESR